MTTAYHFPAGTRVTFDPALIGNGRCGDRGLIAGPSFTTPGLVSVLLPTPCDGYSLHEMDPAALTRVVEGFGS